MSSCIWKLRERQRPGWVKGGGEAGTIAAPAAVVNAISDAFSPFGVSIDRVPVTPVYLRDLLRDAGH